MKIKKELYLIMLKPKLFICLFALLFSTTIFAQNFREKLAKIPGITFNQIYNEWNKERFEIFLEQPIDHNNPSSSRFRQRIVIDFRSEDSATVMDTDGYAINYALSPNYHHELADLLNANLIIIEHRFFGHSVPDSIPYPFLTTSQAAADVHYVRTLLAPLFKKKWISTGISKGGQAALAHKIYYPDDVTATVVYGAAVKRYQTEKKIDSMLNAQAQTKCGKKLSIFQNNLINNKNLLLPHLNDFVFKNGIAFGNMDNETVLEYMILELPFSFWQSGADCSGIPLTTEEPLEMFRFLSSVITPSFYSLKTLKRLEPSFYMSYHELGYYEYDTKKFKSKLKQSSYSNKRFCPAIKISFDKTYLQKLSNFLKTKEAENVLFIYGEIDPWSSMQSTGKAKKLIIKNGSHKSRINDMSPLQKNILLNFLKD